MQQILEEVVVHVWTTTYPNEWYFWLIIGGLSTEPPHSLVSRYTFSTDSLNKFPAIATLSYNTLIFTLPTESPQSPLSPCNPYPSEPLHSLS
jgi:hypothetical protein